MDIIKKDIDSLNAILSLTITEEDYASDVEKILKDYRKTVTVPGFRKGQVPMGMIKKQYGQAVKMDEVNKLIQNSINEYITNEKLELLGNPLPINQEEVDWNAKDFSLDFEIGLAPKFEVDLDKINVTHYDIVVSDDMANKQIEHIQKQYGKLISQEEVVEGVELTGSFENEEANIDFETTFNLDELKRKGDIKKFIGKKAGDSIVVKTKNLFTEGKTATIRHLGVAEEIAETIDVDVTFIIDEINTREEAELNQELFDKLFGKDEVTSKEELFEKIKTDGKVQFSQQGDQKLLDDLVEELITKTEFDLPAEFLQRWLQANAEEPITAEEAVEEYNNTEKGLRYQLIEGKLSQDNKLQPDFEELKDFAGEMIKAQMAQFGQLDPKPEDIEPIVMRVLSDQNELQRLHQQLVTKKMLDFLKENVKLTTKEVDFEQFAKEAYGA